MKQSTNSNTSANSTRYIGPKFEDSEAYKTVSLQVEENIKSGRKKEEKRQKRMNNIRQLDKDEHENVEEEKNNDNDYFF